MISSITNNSFIPVFLPGRVWKEFTKRTTGEWKEELTFHHDPVSTTRLGPRSSLILFSISLFD